MGKLDRRQILAVALSSIAIGFVTAGSALLAQGPEPTKGIKYPQINATEMRQWLEYLASDELQGRQAFTEGYGLAASYVADHLKTWGVKPIGDEGTYFQGVKLRGYRVTRNSSVTVVAADGTSTIFKHGDHVAFAAGPGGKQRRNFTEAELIGYGRAADLQGRNVENKLVIWLPDFSSGSARGGSRAGAGPAIGAAAAAAIGFNRSPTEAVRALTQSQEALQKATEAVQQALAQVEGRSRPGGTGARGRGTRPPADFTTAHRVDAVTAPELTGDEAFFEAVFAAKPGLFAELKATAEKGEPIAPTTLPVNITIDVDNTFEVVSEQRTRNVIGMVEGTDPGLKDTYVLFGAHLDHVGYSQVDAGDQPTTTACRTRSEAAQAAVKAAGKVVQNPGRERGGSSNDAPAVGTPADNDSNGQGPAAAPHSEQSDLVRNGADDDGSGSTALMAIAKAFATGPKPKRSVVFVWHADEEGGLHGARYSVDFPVVPLDKVQTMLNMDMIGRDDCDNLEGDYTNTVFLVGADRISTDLHNLIVKVNDALPKPLTLDYELNDPLDPENLYTRSDHYLYAAKGIPITFFHTGLHPDYHKVTDSVDKIQFAKMARITQLVYHTGFAIANSERVLKRDNRGARTGFGTKAEVIR